MIRIEHKSELKGAEKYGECSNCGTNENISKITFYHEESTQQHSLRLCEECAYELANRLILNNVVK